MNLVKNPSVSYIYCVESKDPTNICSYVLSISHAIEFLSPVPKKFMVGAIRHFTLQPMARTNHKFPRYRGGGGGEFGRTKSTLVYEMHAQ